MTSETLKVPNTIDENSVISLEKPNTFKVLDKKLNNVNDKQQIVVTDDNLAKTSTFLCNKKENSTMNY